MTVDLNSIIHSEGIKYWGIADADLSDSRSELSAQYHRWIEEGRHGTMYYLENHEPMKYAPAAILPGTRSVIIMALSYFPGRTGEQVPKAPTNPGRTGADGRQRGAPDPGAGADAGMGAGKGRISLYATGRDYHREFGARLRRIVRKLEATFPNEQFRSFTDTAPLHERAFAKRAGMVFTGKNTLSLHRELGSYFFLGEILSTHYFPVLAKQPEADSHCPSSCTRCIDVCPTGALESPFRINAGKCISYLTIEHKGPIPKELRRGMGKWIFGCDLCQDVCPFNVRAQITDVENFKKPLIASEQELAHILDMKTHEEFTALYAGTPVMRAGRVSMIRNALIAAANTGCSALLPQIRRLTADADEVIAESAQWARAELEQALKPGVGEPRTAKPQEPG